MAAPFPLTQIFDNCVRANQTPAVGWADGPFYADTGVALRITSNVLIGNSTGAGVFNSSLGPLNGVLPFEWGYEFGVMPANGFTAWCESVLGLTATPNGYGMSYTQSATTPAFRFYRLTAGAQADLTSAHNLAAPLAAGDAMGFRVWADQTWETWKRSAGSWTLEQTGATGATYTSGRIGIELESNVASVRNVFGGTIPQARPRLGMP